MFNVDPRRDQPQERAGCVLGEAGNRVHQDHAASTRPPAKNWTRTCKRLGENNINGLVLDLRGNPGGLLNEGVAVADHFLQKGAADRVASRARVAGEGLHGARTAISGRDYPIVVLVNRYSASAAEIVSGALQDHDRALDSGRDHIRQGSGADGVPAGREHRPGADDGAFLYAQRPPDPARLLQQIVLRLLLSQGRERAEPLDVKMTDSGRTVYGGGGITPDEKFETPQAGHVPDRSCCARTRFFNFTRTYFGKHDAKLPKGWDAGRSGDLNELHEYLLKKGTSSPKPSSRRTTTGSSGT